MRSETLAGVIARTVSFIVWIVVFMMILSVLGINIAPILAAVGLAGLAVGFAAQNIIRDYFHGFFIIMEDWFRVGEVATIAGETGLVVDMGLRRTTLRDLNGTMHIVPNGKIELASNMARDWARINLDISVSYNENLDKVIQVINAICQQLKDDSDWGSDLLTTPKVERVNNLGDSGIDIKILGDTKPGRQWALTGELRKRLKGRFDEEGIEIPWPHTKVYFGNTPADKGSVN
jgi:small conductance mechanosensitive channel